MPRLVATMSIPVLALSACGAVKPTIDPTRYAMPGDAIGPGSSFATQDVKRSVYVNGSQSLKDQTVKVRFSDDGQKVYITQNHKDYVLTNDGAGYYSNSIAEFFIGNISNEVDVAWFKETSSGYSNTGSFVIGFPTYSNQVTARHGTAVYTGGTTMDADTDTLYGYGAGQVALTANFDTKAITGTMNISDSGVTFTTLVVPNTTVTINPLGVSNISGNSFDANLGIVAATAPGDTLTINQSGLQGGFYGVNASGVGATYWATGTYNGENLYIQGALAAH